MNFQQIDPTNLHFHPVSFAGVEAAVEGHSPLDDHGGGVDTDQVEYRGLQHGALHQPAQGTGAVPAERDVGPPDVLLHQPGQVIGVYVVGEVVLVHLQQVVGPLCVVVA